MDKVKNKGKFITLYGINNIGKSTHAKKLVKYLKQRGYDAVYLKYPIYDLFPTGPRLNQILRDSGQQSITEAELQTVFMQNRLNFQPQLQKMLQKGKIVISEDYIGTGIAWGMAKGLSLDWMEKLNAPLLKEDLSILLMGRRDEKAQEEHHLHEQNHQLMDKVAKTFLVLAEKYHWGKIKIQPTIEETAQILKNLVQKYLR